MKETSVSGTGLHTGREARVVLRARAGPLAFSARGIEVLVRGVPVAAVDHATTVDVAGSRVATVEHLLGACAGMGIHEGLVIEMHGDEVPLSDGGAGVWCDALLELGIASSPPSLIVQADGVVEVGASRYAFGCGAARLRVSVDYGDPRVSSEASWTGDAKDFRERIAPARTFAFARDLEELSQRGLAWHATPSSVVLVRQEEILCAGRPFEADEPARHKLLDLAGDLVLYGGPPLGTLDVVRPGHAATHAAMRIAHQRGLVGPP